MVYLETSALAKLYIVEAESTQVESLVERRQPWLYTSRVTYAEVLSLLARCLREKRIGHGDYGRQKRRFLRDWNALHIVELTAFCLAPVERVIETYALRGFDAVHLSSALLVGVPWFACFDSRLRKAAQAEGLAAVP